MKGTTAAFFIMLLMGQPWPRPSLALMTDLFHKVSVSQAIVMSSQRLEIVAVSQGTFSNIRHSAVCILKDWCDLWCRDASSEQSFFSDMIVMPTYADPNSADAIACYTRRHPDYAAGAVIEATVVHPWYVGSREKTNLVDGIYDRMTMNQCFDPNEVNYPWFMLDFGVPVSFRLVKFYAQPKGAFFMIQRISNLEVRVGVSPATTLGDFSPFSLFGFFAGPAVAGQEIVLGGAFPVTARFVSVQKMGLDVNFQLCHIEVY